MGGNLRGKLLNEPLGKDRENGSGALSRCHGKGIKTYDGISQRESQSLLPARNIFLLIQ